MFVEKSEHKFLLLCHLDTTPPKSFRSVKFAEFRLTIRMFPVLNFFEIQKHTILIPPGDKMRKKSFLYLRSIADNEEKATWRNDTQITVSTKSSKKRNMSFEGVKKGSFK